MIAAAVWAWLLAFGPGVTPAIAAQLSRLEGQRVTVAADGASFTIDDVAGEGAPVVGVVERRGKALWLRADDGRELELVGPLAIPRIAGPGYRVWALGDVDDTRLRARRLGVLAPPEGGEVRE